VNASEDTKCGPSVVAESLRSLTEQAKLCHQKIDLLEAGQTFNRAEILVEVGKLLDACQNLRDAILSEDSTATWSTKAELGSLIGRLEDTAAKRRRYLDLAQYLATGTIIHRRERTRQERLALRDAAVAELMGISERSNPPDLPGPAIESWLEWACGLDDESGDDDLQKLKASFPRLDDFVRQLEMEWWHDGPPAAADRRRGSAKSTARNGSSGAHATTAENGNGYLAQPTQDVLSETAVLPAEPALPVEPLLAIEPALSVEAEPSAEPAEPIEPAETIEPKALLVDESKDPFASEEILDVESPILNTAFIGSPSGEEIPIPAEMLSPSRKGKVSFFSWDQVDQFTQQVERARVERKDARTVRALLAVSHWLDLDSENPVFHPRCGIRALTGYNGTADHSVVSPADVTQAITLDDGLPLLTGGADLLRWGLLQPAERNFQGIASVRRLSPEHLKAWFSDIFRIALSDKQIEDIYTLTSGIPYLVGELQKFIIPHPEDPPTWLGLARWMEIKAMFEKQIPEMAHELKKGMPSVRLTDREISLLNMVVIVSGDSTRENIFENLSENWERYQHPEYRALGSRDEVSLAVLLELGLLPRRSVSGVEPSRCLLPVKHDDAIRKIVEHL
jgi:hypothetical protein